ncbi:helix-turn-helix domain-containing protein [Rubrivirga sp.]|uniref:helix-turn-helix domain-containing protein n=1 Tax=Rubrivirga sp. TaxID=1885344 RepID=UPI003C728A4E
MLAQAIRPAVVDVLADVLPEQVRRALAKPYYTVPEVMDLTGWSRRKVDYLRERREVDFIKRGRTVLFPAEALHAYLDAGLVSARKTIASP